MELVDDQINSPAFQKLCTHIWSSQRNDIYIDSVLREHNPNLKVVYRSEKPNEKKGVIFVGINQLIEDFFDQITREVDWIVIHRTNDRSFTEEMYKKKPANVKHIYSVDCAVKYTDVTAIPLGLASIMGFDSILKEVSKEQIPEARTKVFVRYNVNNSGYTEERKASIPILQSKDFCKVITEQIPGDEFYRQIKAHKFTMSLKGHGKDACRTWSAVILGSIPIVTDCIEMRHFEDMPIVYCPDRIRDFLTLDWLRHEEKRVKGKSTERLRMSYWAKHLENKRLEYGI